MKWRSFIGVEVDPDYFAIAQGRIERELAQGRLALPETPRPVAQELALVTGENHLP